MGISYEILIWQIKDKEGAILKLLCPQSFICMQGVLMKNMDQTMLVLVLLPAWLSYSTQPQFKTVLLKRLDWKDVLVY